MPDKTCNHMIMLRSLSTMPMVTRPMTIARTTPAAIVPLMVFSGFIGPPGAIQGFLFSVVARGLPPLEDGRRIGEIAVQFNDSAGKNGSRAKAELRNGTLEDSKKWT